MLGAVEEPQEARREGWKGTPFAAYAAWCRGGTPRKLMRARGRNGLPPARGTMVCEENVSRYCSEKEEFCQQPRRKILLFPALHLDTPGKNGHGSVSFFVDRSRLLREWHQIVKLTFRLHHLHHYYFEKGLDDERLQSQRYSVVRHIGSEQEDRRVNQVLEVETPPSVYGGSAISRLVNRKKSDIRRKNTIPESIKENRAC